MIDLDQFAVKEKFLILDEVVGLILELTEERCGADNLGGSTRAIASCTKAFDIADDEHIRNIFVEHNYSRLIYMVCVTKTFALASLNESAKRVAFSIELNKPKTVGPEPDIIAAKAPALSNDSLYSTMLG